MKYSTVLALAACLHLPAAHAVNIITGSSGAAGTAYLTLEHDVLFTINTNWATNPNHISFVIDQAIYPNDGSKTNLTGSGLRYQISSDAIIRTVTVWRDNLANSAGHVTPADGQLYDTDESVNAFPALKHGDTIRLFAGTFAVNAGSSAFSVMPSGDYRMFVTSNNGYAVSGDGVSVSSVPETHSYAMMLAGVGLLGYLVRRRKAGQR